MEKNNNFAQFPRELQSDPVYTDNLRFKALADIIYKVNYKDRYVYINGEQVLVRKNQMTTTIRRLCEVWGCSIRTVENILKQFETEGRIKYKSIPHKYTLITLVNRGLQGNVVYNDEYTDENTDKYTDEYTDENVDISNKKEYKDNNDVDTNGTSIIKQFEFGVIKNIWNGLEETGNIQPITGLTKQDEKNITELLKNYNLADFSRAAGNIKNSTYLKNNATFSWFINPKYFEKILNNGYKDFDTSTGNGNSKRGIRKLFDTALKYFPHIAKSENERKEAFSDFEVFLSDYEGNIDIEKGKKFVEKLQAENRIAKASLKQSIDNFNEQIKPITISKGFMNYVWRRFLDIYKHFNDKADRNEQIKAFWEYLELINEKELEEYEVRSITESVREKLDWRYPKNDDETLADYINRLKAERKL